MNVKYPEKYFETVIEDVLSLNLESEYIHVLFFFKASDGRTCFSNHRLRVILFSQCRREDVLKILQTDCWHTLEALGRKEHLDFEATGKINYCHRDDETGEFEYTTLAVREDGKLRKDFKYVDCRKSE